MNVGGGRRGGAGDMWRAREEVTLARRGGGESVPRPGEVDVPSSGRRR